MPIYAEYFEEPQDNKPIVPARASREWVIRYLHLSAPEGESSIVRIGTTAVGMVGGGSINLSDVDGIRDGPGKPITLSSTGPVGIALLYGERKRSPSHVTEAEIELRQSRGNQTRINLIPST